MNKLTVLQQTFGYQSFRPGQESVIDALLSKKDVLSVMPTGAGKSLCYQIPALLLSGVTLVISPLISLMKDQVAALTQAGVAAAFINSSLNEAQTRKTLRNGAEGKYKIIYVAPERLQTTGFMHLCQSINIAFVAIDEAHCVSQWGQDFRPGYLKIAGFMEQLPGRPLKGAFTATATAEVKEDIIRLLRLQNPFSITTGFDRPNLYFNVITPAQKSAFTLNYLKRYQDLSGIIYCATRNTVDTLCAQLQKQGFAAGRYHAGLDDDERRRNQEDFDHDRIRIMVATNAFGMGIDKSNIGFVLHYNMPKNLESYYQEAGRAGRDGVPADCVLLFSNGDVRTAKYLIMNSENNGELSDEERLQVRQRDLERLQQMISYCKTPGCLRSFLLQYFGEHKTGNCGNCGNCDSNYELKDITIEAQKILSAVARLENKYGYDFGITIAIRMLHGSKDKRVLQLGLDTLPTYGIMKDTDRKTIRTMIDFLIEQKYLRISSGEFAVLSLTKYAREILFEGKTVLMPVKLSPEEKFAPPSPLKTATNNDLLEALKALRTKLAQEANVPAYIVFSNATLADMAAKQPRNMQQFLNVSGVGGVKAQRYGNLFISAIEEYLAQ